MTVPGKNCYSEHFRHFEQQMINACVREWQFVSISIILHILKCWGILPIRWMGCAKDLIF